MAYLNCCFRLRAFSAQPGRSLLAFPAKDRVRVGSRVLDGAWIHEQLVTDPAAWINLVEAHLVGFNNPCEILEHFFGFLDKKMFDWYFSL